MIAFSIGALGMCGAPPVAGFVSKWYLCLGAVQAGSMVLLSVVLISSLLDVVYFFPIVKKAFFDSPAKEAGMGSDGSSATDKEKTFDLFMVLPLSATAVLSVVFCFFPGMFYIVDLAELAIASLF
jgi:formate hydrogenlyase subunit 3/multisubunit Na+/H+ antiporter MnhD subunit